MPPSCKRYVFAIIHADYIKCDILVNTGHAQYLGKWYCPIIMRDATANQPMLHLNGSSTCNKMLG